MKKAFDENVSRSKPRLRLGAAMAQAADEAVAALAAPALPAAAAVVEGVVPQEPPAELTAEIRARAERARAPKPTAAEAVERALGVAPNPSVVEGPTAVQRAPTASAAEPKRNGVHAVRAAAEPPPGAVEVQTPGRPTEVEAEGSIRRERLKERLKQVRENPRPEPLPATVAEAGVLAVERIAHLQQELGKANALNLALTQDLESSRRQSERATEEARSRMEEARRLSSEMEARAKLLAELERELGALEAERDQTLLALQTTRQTLDGAAEERKVLEGVIVDRDRQLADSLAEEERLCDELEGARTEAQSLRKAVETLHTERDTLARQVSELTKERIELLEARKALEAVHRALSKATARS